MTSTSNDDLAGLKKEHSAYVRKYALLKANDNVRQRKFNKQTTDHEAERDAWQAEVASLKAKLQEAQTFSDQREVTLATQEQALSAREQACDCQYAKLQELQQNLEAKVGGLEAGLAALTALKLELENQEKRLADKELELYQRELCLVQKETQSRKPVTTASSATAKHPQHVEGRKPVQPIAATMAANPRPKVNFAPKSAYIPRSGATTQTAPVAKFAESHAARALPLPAHTGPSSAKPSISARGERNAIASKPALPVSKALPPVTKRPHRSAQEIMADADAIIAKRTRQTIAQTAVTDTISCSQPASKVVSRSVDIIRAKEKSEPIIAPAKAKLSNDDVPMETSKVRAPRFAKPVLESGTKRAFQDAFTDDQIRFALVATKRARPSLIPLSKRLHPRYMPRAIAIAV